MSTLKLEFFYYDRVSIFCFVCRFRRQHEQLRQVIVRVLRPTVVSLPSPGTPSEEQSPKKVAMGIDAADASAIEEVNLAYDNAKEVDCLDTSKEGNDAWDASVKR